MPSESNERKLPGVCGIGRCDARVRRQCSHRRRIQLSVEVAFIPSAVEFAIKLNQIVVALTAADVEVALELEVAFKLTSVDVIVRQKALYPPKIREEC